MRILAFGRFALSVGVAAALPAGCGGTQSPMGAMPQTFANAAPADRGGESSAPRGRDADASVIYVADSAGDRITAYDLSGELTQTITAGINGPFGVAVDTNRKIYVTNAFPRHFHGNVTTYMPDGKQTTPTITEGISTPHDVLVDKSGKIYVTNLNNYSGTGFVTTYKPDGTRTKPTITTGIDGPIGGGTILAKHGSKYEEIVWPLTGGGCARRTAKPSWQHDPGCKYRTQNDVAAVAWGVAAYDTYDSYTGWITVAGTSIATPLIAATYALAGNASSQHAGRELWTLTTHQRKQFLHAITEGSNGDCGGSYLCEAGTGQYNTYSGPAGWGTPNGIGAF